MPVLDFRSDSDGRRTIGTPAKWCAPVCPLVQVSEQVEHDEEQNDSADEPAAPLPGGEARDPGSKEVVHGDALLSEVGKDRSTGAWRRSMKIG